MIVPLNGQQFLMLSSLPTPPTSGFVAQVSFATDDLVATMRFLTAKGIAFSMQKGTITSEITLKDPEGNRIGFTQRRPASKNSPLVYSGLHMIHAGFVVKDLAAENRFYVDLLGFRLYWHGGFKDDGEDWYEIQVPDGSDWIEYMLNIPANADRKELGIQNHISIGVKDIHAAAEELRKNGIDQFDGPEIGRDGKWSIDAYDPDGTRVEIMEFAPTKEPCCHPYTATHPKP